MQVKTNIDTETIDTWSEIDWKSVNNSVTKLRRRIFDAKRNNNYSYHHKNSVIKLCEPCTLRGVCTAPKGGF